MCGSALRRCTPRRTSSATRYALASVWRDAKTDDIPAHMLATLAVSVVDAMEMDDLKRLREQFAEAIPPWMPFVLDALLDASVRSGRVDVGLLAEREMRSWIVRDDADASIRVNAAVLRTTRALAPVG